MNEIFLISKNDGFELHVITETHKKAVYNVDDVKRFGRTVYFYFKGERVCEFRHTKEENAVKMLKEYLPLLQNNEQSTKK